MLQKEGRDMEIYDKGLSLCKRCIDRIETCNHGRCQCGIITVSGVYEVCSSCAKKQNICQRCQRPIRNKLLRLLRW